MKKRKVGKIKNQFVLMIGDDGAILCHYLANKLSSRIFVDSATSQDVALFEKLLSAYPLHPITLLIDVIEQNYTHQVLPPVSSMGVAPQVQRRIKRDLNPSDLNNFIISGRSKDGRKDWNVLFISLANTEPFAAWLKFVKQQNNHFGGIFLLPVEAVQLLKVLGKKLQDGQNAEWQILLLHNKTGGFRIVTYRNDKLVFARLAQNLVGDSIAEIVVGNIEQELQNTFEYLKRLGFKSEANSKVIVVSSADILEKLDANSIKAKEVSLLSPYQISQLVNLPEIVGEKDKFADIFVATFFALQKKHVLKMHDKFTKKLDQLYLAAKTMMVIIGLLLTVGVGYQVSKFINVIDMNQQVNLAAADFQRQLGALSAKQKLLKSSESSETEKILATYNLYNLLPKEKYRFASIVAKIAPEFGNEEFIKSISFMDENTKKESKDASAGVPNLASDPNANELLGYKDGQFTQEVIVEMNFVIPRVKSGKISQISEEFLAKIKKALPDAQVMFEGPPSVDEKQSADFFADGANGLATYNVKLKIIPSRSSYQSQRGRP